MGGSIEGLDEVHTSRIRCVAWLPVRWRAQALVADPHGTLWLYRQLSIWHI